MSRSRKNKEYRINAGIYKITNLVNNKIYIGSSKFLNRRKSAHFKGLENNNHNNIKLQRAYNKYGIENFSFDIIETLENYDRIILLKREQYYLDTLLFASEFLNNQDKRFRKLSYNILPIAGSPTGRVMPQEEKEKRRFIWLGRKHTEESKMKMSMVQKGKKWSEESKEKMRKPWSEERKKNHMLYVKNRKLPHKDAGKNSLIGRKLQVLIGDKEYLSTTYAAKDLNVSHHTIQRRIASDKFPEYKYKYK